MCREQLWLLYAGIWRGTDLENAQFAFAFWESMHFKYGSIMLI